MAALAVLGGWLGPTPAAAAKLVLFAGGGTEPDNAPATKCQLKTPFGLVFDAEGTAFLVEIDGHRLLKIDRAGNLKSIAGTGEKGFAGNGGPATAAKFNSMHSLALAPAGGILLADTFNHCVRAYHPRTGEITAFAGTGEKGFSGDGGPAIKARFEGIYCLAVDVPRNRLLLADLENHRIRAVDLKTGMVSTFAGNGKAGVPQNGAPADDSPLVDPRAVAVDSQGNVYILERGGNALRVVDVKHHIRTVAGTGKAGDSGDGGDALQATLRGPKHLCVDSQDRVVIADTDNHVIRRYDPATGRIERVAGTGVAGSAGVGGDPLKCALNQPHGVTVDAHGVLYIVDSHNNRVLQLAP
ncbi:MAG TPA: hypothetical protein VFE24_11750 [Pirellulales bacterium]|jgi:sugar lactone lactonase YvrE|nr:hypothetical protein [Pirellulales bacterium]